MKKILLSLLAFSALNANAQSFLNGSFENTSGTCDFNLPNATFNSTMDNSFAFGSASQLDILNNTCGYGNPQQGTVFIGLAGGDVPDNLTDALSLQLSTTLTAGTTYMLNFYNRKDSGYDASALEVGYSADAQSFGTSIGTASVPTTSWGLVSFTFTPSIASEFITIRVVPAIYSWNFIDNFTITSTAGIDDNAISNLEMYPNPTNGLVNISNIPVGAVINVSDASGRIIATQTSEMNAVSFDLTNQENGVYFVSILGTDGTSTIKKLIVRK